MITVIFWILGWIAVSFLGMFAYISYRDRCMDVAFTMREDAYKLAQRSHYSESTKILADLEAVSLMEHANALMWRKSMATIYTYELINLMQWK